MARDEKEQTLRLTIKVPAGAKAALKTDKKRSKSPRRKSPKRKSCKN